jgi:hypothetical protein
LIDGIVLGGGCRCGGVGTALVGSDKHRQFVPFAVRHAGCCQSSCAFKIAVLLEVIAGLRARLVIVRGHSIRAAVGARQAKRFLPNQHDDLRHQFCRLLREQPRNPVRENPIVRINSPIRCAQCPPVTVYPARRRSSAKSFSIWAAASNGMGFRCSYNSGSRRMPNRFTSEKSLMPAL